MIIIKLLKYIKTVIYKCAVIIFIIANFNCNNSNGSKNILYQKKDTSAHTLNVNSATGQHSLSIKDFYKNINFLDRLVDSIYGNISVEERAAQMIMPATEKKGYGLKFSVIADLLTRRMIGDVLLLKGRKTLFTDEVTQLNNLSSKQKVTAPIFICDCEPTLFHKKFTDADAITISSKLKTPGAVKESGR